MCCNTNECGCSLFNSLFNLNRSGCNSCCGCNGWNSWGNCRRSCGCNSCHQGTTVTTNGNGTTTVTTNGNGCGSNSSQFFSIPVSGRIILRTGNRSGCGWNWGCNGASTFDNFDSYYARQYGLTNFGNSRSCGCGCND